MGRKPTRPDQLWSMVPSTPSTPKRNLPVPPRIWRPIFLKALRDTCNVRASCDAAGIERTTAYKHRDRDPAFAAQWEVALQDAVDLLEKATYDRAKAGLSDTLAIFLLKSYRPERFRETINHRIDIVATIRQYAEANGLDPDEAVLAAEHLIIQGN